MKVIRAESKIAIEMLERRRLLASIYVDVNSPAVVPTGAAWDSAFRDLQQALTVAAAGDEIRVADGTYWPTSTSDRSISFALKNGVSLVGGYAGYGAVHPDARDTGQFVSSLSGDIGASGTRTDNSFHVLVASATNSTAILDGFTVTAGHGDTSPSPNNSGGGMYMAAGSSPTVRNCTFVDNRSTNGNAIYCAGSLPSVSNCLFDSNVPIGTGTAGGGAIAGAANMTDCTFRNNNGGSFGGAISHGSGGQVVRCIFENNSASTGGAIWSQSSTVIVTDCTFITNTASGSIGGGAIYCNGGSLTATGCTFTENQSSNALGTAGGAIYVQVAPATITRCSFVRNRGLNGAGIYLSSNTTPQPSITNCTFKGNRAVTTSVNGNGGGVYIHAGAPTIANCTFVGNFAGNGGGLVSRVSSASPSVINCDFIANTASSSGGGVYNNSSNQTLIDLKNCILRGNTAAFGPQMGSWWGGLPAFVSFSNVQGGGGTIDADALFVRNPAPGADSLWGTADDDYGDLRLQIQSPCIDAGSNTSVPAGVTADVAGLPRFFDFPGVHDPGATVDMGAHELGMTLGLLRVAAGQTLSLPGGRNVFLVEELIVAADSTLDVADNTLIIDYSSVSPVGVWTGSAYDGITGMIQSGRIISSAAAAPLTTLGVAEAREALGITGTQTATFSGQSVDSTAVLIKFTWGGDATLDGKINIDDYGRIDGHVAQSGSVFGWFNGDFNLDGKINIDDYGIIDGNINQQDEIL